MRLLAALCLTSAVLLAAEKGASTKTGSAVRYEARYTSEAGHLVVYLAARSPSEAESMLALHLAGSGSYTLDNLTPLEGIVVLSEYQE